MKTSIVRLAGALAIVAAGALLASCKDISTVKIGMPDLGRIPDGTYTGTELVFPVRAKVAVGVQGGRLSSFTILGHFSSSHGKPAEQLASIVLEKQTLLVDAVAGATISSKVILKAAENALTSAR